jgi:threonine aldolase
VILDAEIPATNMVFFRMQDSIEMSEAQVEAQLRDEGILVHATGPRRFRLVTHYWIDDRAVEATVEAFTGALRYAGVRRQCRLQQGIYATLVEPGSGSI